MIDAAGADNLMLQYDVFHMQIVEGDLAKTLERLLPRIGHIQVADVPDRHEPGTGEINFPWLLAHIDRLGYQGWIGAEYIPKGDTARRTDSGQRLTCNRFPAGRSSVAKALRAFLPERSVLWEPEDTRPYECDGLTAYRRVPMVVALPETEAQVQRILQTCHALGVPVVPRGAGTGLSGGALPPGDGVLLSLAKFMRVAARRSAGAHRGGAARRAQRGDLGRGRALRPVLRA